MARVGSMREARLAGGQAAALKAELAERDPGVARQRLREHQSRGGDGRP